MINTDRLSRVLTILGHSGRVKNGRGRMSAQLIAPSDAGKTQLLQGHIPRGALVINDFTYASLLAIIDRPKPPLWIVVPDFNTAISHKPSVANLTMSVLLPLLGEGITDIPDIEGHPRLRNGLKRAKDRGITIAMLTGMTPEMFFSHRGKWRSTGLLRRLVPLYYTYHASTVRLIQATIRDGDGTLNYSEKRATGPTSQIVIDIPSRWARELEQLSEQITTTQLVWTRPRDDKPPTMVPALDFPFSVQKTVRTYAQTCALVAGRTRVIADDMDDTRDFAKFVRYDRPEYL